MSGRSDVPRVPRRDRAGPPDLPKDPPLGRLAIFGYTVCGLAATATPLLLWMAWSETVYYLVLLNGFLACCGIVLLSKFLPEYREAERRERRQRKP